VAKNNAELGNPHPHRFEVSSSDTYAIDLSDHLTRKRRVHQIAPNAAISDSLQQCSLSAIVALIRVGL